MTRAQILAELDRFQGRAPAPAPPAAARPRARRLQLVDHFICIRPRAGFDAREAQTVYVVGENEGRWLAHPSEHTAGEPPLEYPKYAWVKVTEGACPPMVIRRRRLAPPEAELMAIPVAAAAEVTEVKLDETTVTIPPVGPERYEFRGVRLNARDRVLVWLNQNREAAAAATPFTAPRALSSFGIAEGTGLQRPVVSSIMLGLERDGLVAGQKRRALPDGRLAIDTWTLTPAGLAYAEQRVRAGVYPPRIPVLEEVPELAERRARSTLREVLRQSSTCSRELRRVQEDLRRVGREPAAFDVEQAELNIGQAQIHLGEALRRLGG